MTTAAVLLELDCAAEARPRRGGWLRLYFGAWGGCAAVYLLISFFNSKEGFLHDLAYTFTSWGVRAVALLPAVWLARRFPLDVPAWPRHLLVHAPMAPLLAAAKGLLVVWISCSWPLIGPIAYSYVLGDLPFNILSYGAVVAGVHAVDYYRRFLERERAAAAYQLRASQLEGQLARAQLDALKMQLHPHFLFNTLNSISALIHEDPEAADVMVSRLSDFLRLVLENAGAQEVPLKDEVRFLDRYLDIQRTRFRERLRAEVSCDPETLDARVPNLLLQPLVENAIRHAVEPRAGGGAVRVRAVRAGSRLALEVRDDGPGLSCTRANGTGVGLANTRARLQRLYGADHDIHLENDPAGGLVLSISLPFRADGEP